MSRYVQTFSKRDQAILNHTAFRPSAAQSTEVEAQKPINALWLNLGCTRWSFPDPNQSLPRIRRGDVTAFREIWIRRRPQNVILDGPLPGHFAPDKWVQHSGGYATLLVAYRTFQLWVHSETPGHAVKFSILDVDQVLTSCSERFHGDEMPTCTGEWARGDERVRWHVQAGPRPELDKMIRSNREEIDKAIRKEHVKQYDVLTALCHSYRPVGDDKLNPDMRRKNQAFNARLDEFFTRLDLSVETVRCLPGIGVPFETLTRHSFQELVGMYQASRDRSVALDYAYFGIP